MRAWERFMAPMAAGKSPIWYMDLGRCMDIILDAQFQADRALAMAQYEAEKELARQTEVWIRENAGAVLTVERVDALLKYFPVWLAMLLPRHEAVLLNCEGAVLILESGPHGLLKNMVAIKLGTAELLARFTGRGTWDSFSQTITAGMALDWRDGWNAGASWYIPCWPFPASVANDCHTAVTGAMGWLGVGYDAARPH
jgi:hypothetical protein